MFFSSMFETMHSIDTKFEHKLPVATYTSWVVQHCQIITQDGGEPPFRISDKQPRDEVYL